MTKSYADTPGNDKDKNKSSSEVANDAARKAEKQVEGIKKEAKEQVEKENK